MAKLEHLKELVSIVNRNKVKNIQIIGSSDTIFDQFYKHLSENKFDTDEEYAHFFYKDSPRNKAYYKLKQRLFDRILNTVFFIDINKTGFSTLQQSYYSCYKNAAAVKILLGKRVRAPAISLAEKTLKQSLNSGFTDIIIELGRHLAMHYSIIDYQKSKYEYYTKLVNKYLKIYKKDIKIEAYAQCLLIEHRNQIVLDKKEMKKYRTQKKFILKSLKKNYSYKTASFGYLYLSMYYELTSNWEKLISICDEIIKKYETSPNLVTSNLLGLAYYRKLNSFFILRNFKDAEIFVKKCQTHFEPDSFNWYLIKNLTIKIALHSYNFSDAVNILHSVIKYKVVGDNYKFWYEDWKINEAFIHYLHRIGKLELGEVKTFRLGKFLNEVPNYSKDKKGSNVTILILQILFLLEDGKYDALIDRAEALKIYTHRYLKDDGTYRSNCFIKMLLCLPAASFDRDQVERKAKKYLEKLQAMPIEKAKQSAELEVMPYEMLWEFVMESLDRNAQKTGPGSRR